MSERRDSKGHRVGARASADKGKFPQRVETGLCPGLEAALYAVAVDLANAATSVAAMAKDGVVGSEGVIALLAGIEGRAHDALAMWAPE